MSRVTFAIAVIAVLMVGVVCGYGFAITQPGAKQQLLDELEALRANFNRQTRELAIARKSAEVDRLANEELRLQMVDYGQQVSALQRDINFYRSLMAPEDEGRGLAIHALLLEFDELKQAFQFTITAKQLGGGNPLLRGEIDAVVRALNDEGVQEQRSLAAMSEFTGDLPAKLRFRFFQNVSGSFKLPSDFSPVSITVSARAGEQVVEREFRWDEIAGES